MAASSANVNQVMKSINQTCKKRGGVYKQYSCKTVSWDDASRGTVGGGLSCWGSNITDTYLKSRSGTRLFTVRPDNWNEKLGCVSTSEVALVVGNAVGNGSKLSPKTLRDVLSNLGQHGQYAGLSSGTDLSDKTLDEKVSIRFQTTFIPVTGHRGTLEFATESYNYNTKDNKNPKNLILLCTTQGLAVQQDGRGQQKLFHHSIAANGKIHRHWLEAERSTHKVGGAQKETAAEKADALKRGKATASVIGVRAMGTRFNVLMTVQVPLKQQKPAVKPFYQMYDAFGYVSGEPLVYACSASPPPPCAPMAVPAFASAAIPTYAKNGSVRREKVRKKKREKQGPLAKRMLHECQRALSTMCGTDSVSKIPSGTPMNTSL